MLFIIIKLFIKLIQQYMIKMVGKGLRQKNMISPDIHLIFIEGLGDIFLKMIYKEIYVNINGEYLNHVQLSTNISLISESSDTL